jgi:flavin-dependent dehydrogenase
MPDIFDLAICGAGPAGTASALAAARSGWRVALIERAPFPRHKVCGDCLNPGVWPVLESLGIATALRALNHAELHTVRLVSLNGRVLEIPLPAGAERAVTRESFDAVMLQAALAAGVTLFSGAPLTAIQRQATGWSLSTASTSLTAQTLIAADGRNSTTGRLLGLVPPARPGHAGRVAVQCHAPLSPSYQGTVALELLSHGYCGIAPVDATRMNLCLVSDAPQLAATKLEAHRRFQLPSDQLWHSLAPLDRPDLPPAPLPGCFLAGDAARVVEPFTGEGIYYALRSGQLAAEAAVRHLTGDPAAASFYRAAHRQLYRHRLWVNRLARLAVTHRSLGNGLFSLGRYFPGLPGLLTSKIISTGTPPPPP